MFTFVTGGLRSGKSAYALKRASELGPPPWLYITTSLHSDADLKQRLAKSRRDQEATWSVVEAPPHLASLLEADRLAGIGAIVLDGFTVWLGHRLASDGGVTDAGLLAEIEALTDVMYRSRAPIVVVTTEVGLGHLPPDGPERRFLDIAGLSNQIIAERAESVVLMVSGAPLRLR